MASSGNNFHRANAIALATITLAFLIFTPAWAQLPTLGDPAINVTFHLNADTLGLANGAPVTTWATDEGPVNGLIERAAIQNPTYETNAKNGHDAVKFDNVDDVMDLLIGVDAASFFLYARMDENPAITNNQLMWLGNASAPAKIYGVRKSVAAGGQSLAFVNDEPQWGTPFSDAGNFALHNWNQGQPLYINGIDTGSNAFGDGTPGALPHWSVAGPGSQIDLFGDERFPDDNPGPATTFAEVVIYDKPLDASDRGLVEDYFENKYGQLVDTSIDGTWTNGGGGFWPGASNWSTTVAPTTRDSTATFGNAIGGSPGTVVVDTDITINKVTFDHDIGSSPSYVVAGAADLIFQSKTVGTPLPAVDVLQGDHQFQVAIRLEDDTTLTVDPSSVLDFNNQIDLNGLTLDTTGGAGTVNINHSVVGGGSITASGILGTAGSTGIGGSLSSTGSLAIDLGSDNTDRFDVTGAATISGVLDVALEAGFTPTSNITVLTASSVDTTGLSLNDPSGTFSGFDSSSGTSIVLQLAAAGNADFNGSGFVDGLDFLIWQRNTGGPGTPATGDANGDNLVNGADLAIWEGQYGSPPPPLSAVSAVPEPTTATLLLLGAMACLGRGRTRK